MPSILAVITPVNVAQTQNMEAQLRACEQRYRDLFERNPQPCWVFDRDTLRLLEVNDAAIELYGYSREEMLAMSTADLTVPEGREAFIDAVGASARGLEIEPHWRHRKKSGELIEVEITARDLVFEQRP